MIRAYGIGRAGEHQAATACAALPRCGLDELNRPFAQDSRLASEILRRASQIALLTEVKSTVARCGERRLCATPLAKAKRARRAHANWRGQIAPLSNTGFRVRRHFLYEIPRIIAGIVYLGAHPVRNEIRARLRDHGGDFHGRSFRR